MGRQYWQDTYPEISNETKLIIEEITNMIDAKLLKQYLINKLLNGNQSKE